MNGNERDERMVRGQLSLIVIVIYSPTYVAKGQEAFLSLGHISGAKSYIAQSSQVSQIHAFSIDVYRQTTGRVGFFFKKSEFCYLLVVTYHKNTWIDAHNKSQTCLHLNLAEWLAS